MDINAPELKSFESIETQYLAKLKPSSPALETYQGIMDMIHTEEKLQPNHLIDVFLPQVPDFDIRTIGRYKDSLLFFRGFNTRSGKTQTVLVHYTQACIVLHPHMESSHNVPPRKKPIGFDVSPEESE